MSEEEGKIRGTVGDRHNHQPQYGTFQGVANYPPPLPPHHAHRNHHHHHPPPAIGLPQPVPPPGGADPSSYPPGFYPHGYQTVTGYAVAEGRPVTESRLPFCGIGLGWFMFIVGFFLAAIPWYVGAIVLTCSRIDYREKPGYIACTIAAILATLAALIGATKGADDW